VSLSYFHLNIQTSREALNVPYTKLNKFLSQNKLKFHRKNKKTGILLKRNMEVLLLNHCAVEKQISITYSECMSVPLVIQDAKRMRHIVI
jgi:hypothetical protein